MKVRRNHVGVGILVLFGALALSACWLVEPEPKEVMAVVDPGVVIGVISPGIYGLSDSGGGRPYVKEMGVTVVRWGGNARSRYNWEINASNTGADWDFVNVPKGDRIPGSAAAEFHSANRSIGAESVLTLPMIGWVAKDRSSQSDYQPPRPRFAFWTSRSPAAAVTDPRRTSILSVPKKPGPYQYPPDVTDGVVYQDEWLAFLRGRLGGAEAGGIRFIEMDNEPMHWWAVHPDVRPTPLGYREYFDLYAAHADAAKAVDPGVQVLAPSAWGWTGYFYSSLDEAARSAGEPLPDRQTFGDVPFIPWFLEQARLHDEARGARTLDMLAVHYYPQRGVFSDATDSRTNGRRLRSTRSLWDGGHRDDSWIARTPEGPAVRLIPRLREWVDRYYPGTSIAITEWSWGAPRHITGGLAVADVLGIFGREGVDLATYWETPDEGSPVYWAFRAYRNYDGEGAAFGDVSVQARSSAPDHVSVYAAKDSQTGRLTAVLINKSPRTEARVDVHVQDAQMRKPADVSQYADGAAGLAPLLPRDADGGKIAVTLPPYSLTVVAVADYAPSSRAA